MGIVVRDVINELGNSFNEGQKVHDLISPILTRGDGPFCRREFRDKMGKLLSRSELVLVVLGTVSLVTPDVRSAAPPRPALRLEVVLREWAKANDTTRSMRYRFTQTEIDLNFDNRVVKKGEVQLLKPDLLRIDVGDPGNRMILLVTEETIHFFEPADKTERVYPRARRSRFHSDKTPQRSFLDSLTGPPEGVVWFEAMRQHIYWHLAGLVGFPVPDLTRLCDLRLMKEDNWYIYLDLQPRRPADKSVFKRMRVVLMKDHFRVRRIWYEHADGNTTTLDFENLDTEKRITPKSMLKGLPEGWTRIESIKSAKVSEKE